MDLSDRRVRMTVRSVVVHGAAPLMRTLEARMNEFVVNILESVGGNVTHSASGVIADVVKPLGPEATRSLASENVMQLVTEARKAARIGE